MVYLCFPNNPTGAVLTKAALKTWVDWARQNGAVLLFDAAYEAYIREPDIPHSIYEVEGAREVAIEFRSFSKSAGFTGTRCAFTVVPKDVMGRTVAGERVPLNGLWSAPAVDEVQQRAVRDPESRRRRVHRRGPARGASAGRLLHGERAHHPRTGWRAPASRSTAGATRPTSGSRWRRVSRRGTSSTSSCGEAHVVGTPGSGFGPSGEGYFRLTAFGSRAQTDEAIARIKTRLTR